MHADELKFTLLGCTCKRLVYRKLNIENIVLTAEDDCGGVMLWKYIGISVVGNFIVVESTTTKYWYVVIRKENFPSKSRLI